MERLVSVAISRLGHLHKGFKSHGELRASLGDEDPYAQKHRADLEGFWTSEERFVTRREAVKVGVESGQLSRDWLTVGRELLSSDINWKKGAEPTPSEAEALKQLVREKDPPAPTESRQVRRARERRQFKNSPRGAKW